MNALGFTVFALMILARTNSNELIFGSVQSAAAVGGVVGGLLMSAKERNYANSTNRRD